MSRLQARAQCPRCHRRYGLTVDGALYMHKWAPAEGDSVCVGSGDRPVEGTVKWYGKVDAPVGAVAVSEPDSALIGRGVAIALALGALLGVLAYVFGEVIW